MGVWHDAVPDRLPSPTCDLEQLRQEGTKKQQGEGNLRVRELHLLCVEFVWVYGMKQISDKPTLILAYLHTTLTHSSLITGKGRKEPRSGGAGLIDDEADDSGDEDDEDEGAC